MQATLFKILTIIQYGSRSVRAIFLVCLNVNLIITYVGRPLKIRVDIRDLWESPKSAVQKSVEALEKTLGHKISPQAQWPALWNELKDRYPDKATFVPTICRITIAWYERLLWRLDSDHFSEWTEEFLSSLSDAGGSGGRIQLHIEVRFLDL